MTSTGSAICGAAAVLGAEPVVKCEGYKTAIAVSTVVDFRHPLDVPLPLMYRTGMLDGLTDTGVAVYTGSHAARGGPCGGGGQRNGSDRYAGNRRDGHHHQDDPCDDARARAGYPGVRAGAPPETAGGHKEKSK